MPKAPHKSNKKLSSAYSFEELDQDLMQLDELFRVYNVKASDRLALLSPITSRIPAKPFSHWLKPLVLLLLTVAFLRMNWEAIEWHISALSRIALIRALPYFDWRYLKNQACLIPKSEPAAPLEQFDCNLCEAFGGFSDFQLQSDEAKPELVHKLIEVDRPVVIPEQILHWITESPQAFIKQLLDKEDFVQSVPCQLESSFHNERLGDIDVSALFRKKQLFDSFFLHFQNCDPAAVRVFRNVTYRPPALPAQLSPITFNWLIWNSRYNTTRCKKVNLIEKIALIGQLFGSTRLRLLPRKNCQNVCPVLDGVLPAGQILLLTSLWDVEYCPGGGSDNVAAILEIKE